MKSPCKDCTERTQACHASCEAYLAFRAKGIEIRKKNMDSYGLRAMLADMDARQAALAARKLKTKRMLRRY